MRTVNVGVIGVGAMGYNHARVYYMIEEANLKAVSDVTQGTLSKETKKYKCEGYLDYKEILEEYPSLYLIASGGVSCIDDIIKLEEAKVPAVIFGKALYEGKIQLKDLKIFI